MTEGTDDGFGSGFGDGVYEAGDPDSDVFDPQDTLTGDGDRESFEEPMDTSYSPPDFAPSGTRWGTTAWEQHEGEPLEMRLAEEEPDVTEADIAFSDARPRAGRLIAPDEGAHPDEEKDMIARDVGRAGFAASAEEAAMHIVQEDDLD